MRVSYTWLRELVAFSFSAKELADVLTRQGLTVDALEHWGRPYENIVVGEVKEVHKHPHADALWICKVDVGKEVLQIVCGAPNVRVGLHVPVALPGAQVGEMTIRKAKLRGVESYGMCCAADELGISGDHSGLLTLDETLRPGTPLEAIVGGEDYIYELDIPNNRPDLLSHVGIAREIWAHLQSREGRGESYEPPQIDLEESGEPIEAGLRVRVEDMRMCPRYMARMIEGVNITSSPVWMQARLYRLGMRSINNVVDITNYVLLEYGHPLHAFDGEKLVGREIIVRGAQRGERLKTLDGVERELDEGMIVIADAERSVALAGVMGGENTEVTEKTRVIALESAYFDAARIRRAAKRLGIVSEAAKRFERGVRGALEAASARAAELMMRYAHGRVRRGVIDVKVEEPRRAVRVHLRRSEELLGMSLEAQRVRATLHALGFACRENTKEEWEVTVPAHRVDVAEYADIAEELARVYGYDAIPVDTQVAHRSDVALKGINACRRAVRRILVGEGLYEAYNPSLVSVELLKRAGVKVDEERQMPLALANATTQEQSVLRTELYPGLLRNIQHNLAHGAKSVRLFEVGRVYRKDGAGGGFAERERCALVLWGQAAEHGVWAHERMVDFFDMKGVVERLLEGLGVRDVRYVAAVREGWHPGRTAVIEEARTGKQLGWAGELHPTVVRAWDLPSGVAIAELDLEGIVEVSEGGRRFKQLPRFPAATRDVAIIVAETTTHAEVMKVIRCCGGPLLRDAALFDLYRGGQIPPGHVSMAYHIVYRSDERTLTDEEVEVAHAALVKALEKELGAQVRV